MTLETLEDITDLVSSDPSSLEHTDDAQEYVLTSALDYFKMKVFEQAIPNFYDGLLPTRRRLINSMRLTKNYSNKKRSLSSIITATSTTAYIAAGDTYSVLCGMGSRFHNQFRYVDTEGNFGTLDGNAPAADRYTYVRLSKTCEKLMLSLAQNNSVTPPISGEDEVVPRTIAFNPKYWEEEYLPARLPMLLINGSSGIAVGLAQRFPRFHYKPIVDNLTHLLRDEPIDWNKAIKFSYPTDPIIISNLDKNLKALKTGHGSIKFRARLNMVRNRNKVLTGVEILSTVPNLWINTIHDKYNNWKSEDKSFPFNKKYDGSEPDSVHLTLTLMPSRRPKPNEEPRFIKTLIKKLGLESSVTLNMMAINNQRLVDYNYETLLKDWLDERIEIHKRGLRLKIKRSNEKLRAMKLLTTVLDNFIEFSQGLLVWDDNQMRTFLNKIMKEVDEKPTTKEERTHLFATSISSFRKKSRPDVETHEKSHMELEKELADDAGVKEYLINDILEVSRFLSKEKP